MKITRLIVFTLTLFIAMSSYSKVNKPDFAFPQTVAKDANADIAKALKANDAKLAMNGLLRLWTAESMVDPSKRPAVIARVEEVAAKFADSDLAGLYDALLAKLYNDYYSDSRWKYNQRQLPLTPLPADLSEWSGEQFKQRIKEYAAAAMSHSAVLKKMKIGEYKDLIEADNLTALYYPTLLDFVYNNASLVYESIDEPIDSILNVATAMATTDAARILWLSKDNDPDSLKAAYLANIGSEYDALLLLRCIEVLMWDDNKDDRWAVEQIDFFNGKYPANPFNANLSYRKQTILRPEASVEMNNLASPGAEFDVKVTSENARKVRVKVYKVSNVNEGYTNSVKTSSLAGLAPVKTYTVDFAEQLPFEADSVLKVKFDAPGYYAIVPEADGTKPDNVCNVVRCIPVYPFAATANGDGFATVVNPADGRPIKGATVYAVSSGKNRNKRALGKTDDLGMVRMGALNGYYRGISVGYQGTTYAFGYVGFSLNVDKYEPATAISLLTDRSLYHPGDRLQGLCIVSEMSQNKDKKAERRTLEGVSTTVKLYNANNEEVATLTGATDAFGRYAFEFDLPTSGLTGEYSVEATVNGKSSRDWFMVSDYRMPDFELVDINVARDVPAKGGATLEGRAVSYSGMPLANVTVTADISEVMWWRWFMPQGAFHAAEAKTDSEGRFKIVLDPDVFDDQEGKGFYMAQFKAASLSGTTATSSATFSLGKPYMIVLSPLGNVDGEKPFAPQAKVLGPDGKEADIALRWTLLDDNDKSVASGNIGTVTDISGVKPATYKLSVVSADTTLADADVESATIYNMSTDVVPDGDRLWLLNREMTYGADRKVVVDLGTSLDGACVYYSLVDVNGIDKIGMLEIKKGYSTLEISVPETATNANLTLMLVHDCQLSRQIVSIKPDARRDVSITCETFRDKLVPNAVETWKFSLRMPDGSPASAALALDMYNKALDALHPHSFKLSTNLSLRRLSYLSVSNPYNGYLDNSVVGNNSPRKKLVSLDAPIFEYISQSFYDGIRMRGISTSYKSAAMMNDCDMVLEESVEYEAKAEAKAAVAPTAGEINSDSGGGGEAGRPEEAIDMRDSDVPLAIWAPILTTDGEGNISYTFTVPNANTTWSLNAVAWTKDWNIGSLQRDFVASKPIMVMPNAPRFLREGDEGSVQALVANKTEVAVLANITIEFFNPINGVVIGRKDFSSIIEAMSTASVAAEIKAASGMSAIGYRVIAKANGNSDGEQGAMPVLPSMASLVETQPFYLNPGQTEFSTLLPADPDARISLTFSENPVWSIVSALPGLRTDITSANSAGAAIFSAALARGIINDNPNVGRAIEHWLANPQDSVLVSMLDKNADLKAAVLNSTPWVQAAQSDSERMANLAMIFSRKETNAAIEAGVTALRKLQKADGGWAWGDWMDESSVWVTECVLDQMAELKRHGWLPANKTLNSMIASAVKFLDRKLDPKSTDMLYAALRPAYSDIPVGENGRRVIVNTVNDILKNWKGYTSPAYKSVAAQVLFLNKYPAKARELMKSVSEFGVMSPSQGLRFPSVNALSSYSVILSAYAMIEPESKEVDGLRQQLIVRKQGADWGSSVVTSEVVAAIISSGTRWTVEAEGAAVTAGGVAIEPAGEIEKYTGSMRADLSAYAGRELVVKTSGTGPAYGAVFSQFSQAMADVKASSCDDLSIEKVMFVRRGAGWETAPAELEVGDVVKVQLTIHCKRNLSYVAIIDERAAAFQPADQLPGWMWSEGVGFYRENRDAATNLYVSYMRPGTYLLTYELNVSNAGTYSSGVATIQSQYAPEISAHSSGTTVKVKAAEVQ